jgi:hypothetical protein
MKSREIRERYLVVPIERINPLIQETEELIAVITNIIRHTKQNNS